MPCHHRRLPAWGAVSGIALMCAAVLSGACSTSSGGSAGSKDAFIKVVAAENFWGNIASQVGGTRVSVTSIITSPDTDPHDYEPRAQDGRGVAMADYVIVNGVGYDPWATKLAAASGRGKQTVLDIGKLVGVKAGGNPHRWYSPTDVQTVIDQISSDYKRMDPAGAAFFDQQKAAFESTGLEPYTSLITDVRRRFSGTPVGASESIVVPLVDALGLALLTPESFLDAISEGTEPTAQDKATTDAQIKSRQIKVYLVNSQNSTPDVKAQVAHATASGIPVVSLTETPPAGKSFQDWQTAQLTSLREALTRATRNP